MHQPAKQSVLVLSEKRNMIRTLPPVVKLLALSEAITAVAGSTVTCRFHLERTSNFPGSMEVQLLQPKPEQGFLAEPVQVAVGMTDFEMQVAVNAQRPAGSETRLKFRATGKLNNRIVVISEATIRFEFQHK